MALRRGIYIVPTHRWYIERTLWLIAGIVLLTATALAALVDARWVLLVIATGLVLAPTAGSSTPAIRNPEGWRPPRVAG
jgi:hypothetical protein